MAALHTLLQLYSCTHTMHVFSILHVYVVQVTATSLSTDKMMS